MADTPVEFIFAPGQTLTVDLYPAGSDTAAATGKAATERTNAKGVYTITVSEALTGMHRCLVKLDGSVVGVFDALLADTTDRVYEVSRAQAIDATDGFLSAIKTKMIGLFRSLARKNATVDADLGGNFDPATDSLEAIRDRGDAAWAGGGGSLSGARTITVTVEDESGDPVENAIVRFTLAADSGAYKTDAAGQVTANLDDGTWTVAIFRSGYQFAGASLTVSADASVTYELTEVSISPPADPAQTTGYLTTYDGQGNVAPETEITFWLMAIDADGRSYSVRNFTATSDANGLLEVALVREAKYRARRDATSPIEVEFTTPDEPTYELPTILGR